MGRGEHSYITRGKVPGTAVWYGWIPGQDVGLLCKAHTRWTENHAVGFYVIGANDQLIYAFGWGLFFYKIGLRFLCEDYLRNYNYWRRAGRFVRRT